MHQQAISKQKSSSLWDFNDIFMSYQFRAELRSALMDRYSKPPTTEIHDITHAVRGVESFRINSRDSFSHDPTEIAATRPPTSSRDILISRRIRVGITN